MREFPDFWQSICDLGDLDTFLSRAQGIYVLRQVMSTMAGLDSVFDAITDYYVFHESLVCDNEIEDCLLVRRNDLSMCSVHSSTSTSFGKIQTSSLIARG